MRKTNADRMFESYMDSSYYYKKSDTVRMYNEGDIFDGNTKIGYIEDLECSDGMYHQFVTLSLQFYKTSKTIRNHIKQIVVAANRLGMLVLFVDALDIGFGRPNTIDSDKVHIDRILTIYKLSNYEKGRRKDAIGMIDDWFEDYSNEYYTRGLYTMSQILYKDIDDSEYTAEKVLEMYLTTENKTIKPHKFICLKQPVGVVLETLIDIGATQVLYTCPDTEASTYAMDIVDLVLCKKQLSIIDSPIMYRKENSKEVDKFFAKEEQ